MKRPLLLASALALVLLALPAQADLLADIRSAGRVRVGIPDQTPPFCHLDAAGKLIGSDIDTAALLASDLGVRLEIVRISTSERIPALLEHRADLVVGVFSITPERERQVAFSVPYASNHVVIAAPRPHSLHSMLDLEAKPVGVLEKSSGASHLAQKTPHPRPIAYPDNHSLSAAYLAGEFEIISAPLSLVEAINRQNPKRPLLTQFTQIEFDIAVGMPKGERPLREWINSWVVKRLQDRKLNEIFHKHHGRDLPESLQPRILPR